jgi:antitoxin (DNA-binding transcriptional repressor) of toxin-antitoxin stability system
MKTLTVGELKTHFSEVLGLIRKGEEITLSFGKKKEKVAVILPYDHYKPKAERQLGLLKGKAVCIIKDDFEISDEEMVSL